VGWGVPAAHAGGVGRRGGHGAVHPAERSFSLYFALHVGIRTPISLQGVRPLDDMDGGR
jgi:hypothetical protein